MTLYVAEYTDAQRLKFALQPAIPLAVYAVTSLSTFAPPQAGADFIAVSADAGMLMCYATSSTPTMTSTNSRRIPAGTGPQFYAISTQLFLCAQST